MTPTHDPGDPHAADAQGVVRFLRTPAAHAMHAPGATSVEAIETHMSWVFLVGGHALKKTVRYPFLDFSTLPSREFHCREELRLNRRLAPGVYLGLMTLRSTDGTLSLVPEPGPQAGGQTIDWLVLMRRLPADRMLDRRLAAGGVSHAEIDALADTLEPFYRTALRADCTPGEYLGRIHREQGQTRDVLLDPAFDLPGAAVALDRFDAALATHGRLLLERAAAGRVVDGHGDLRPEHVCLEPLPVVIDALDFNPALRQVDPFDELAFLGMECELAGALWIGPRLMRHCAVAWGDEPPPALLRLYAAHRALLRARLAAAHLLDSPCRTPERWLPLAQRYLDHGLRTLVGVDPRVRLSTATLRGRH